MQVRNVVVFISETGRRYIDADDVAAISGIDSHALDKKFRPYSWAMPRDFLWRARTGKLWFAEQSLPQLVDSFFDAAESDAAIRLREWLVQHLSASFAAAQKIIPFDAGTAVNLAPTGSAPDARYRGPAPAGGTTPAAAVSTPLGAPARIEDSLKKGWSAKWEDQHG